ncbi:MAG: glycoside hydrolase family 78 protein [Chloroflexi bacterium]|nr:glycoside hydrolase family 78 protein [Chloroflexota bacterium]
MTTIANLICEYRANPLGIDVTAPRLGWQMQTEHPGARQTAYRLFAASDPVWLTDGKADLWDSGKIESDRSTHIPYDGQPLKSRQRMYWNVTVWDENGMAHQSDTAWFEIGLLERENWIGNWIGVELRGGPRSMIPAPYLRKAFVLPGTIKSARLYITALGLYACSINGQTVGDHVLSPGWTDYTRRVHYQVYDVTDSLRGGENAIGVILGDGWAVGHLGWSHRQQYAERPHLLAQLEVRMGDGSAITIATDSSWKYQFGPLLNNDLLMGEEYDARLEMPGWDSPHFDDSTWHNVKVLDAPEIALVATNGPVMRRIQELKPISDPVDKSRSSSPRYIFDLGQNMVGRVRLKGSAPAGTNITLRFAEVLNPDGSLYTTNLRNARATDYYTFKGNGEELWEPTFTFHGFRYVELTDYPGTVTRDTITGIVIHSDMLPTGDFECSDPLVNQLQRNIVWGQKGNFVDVPTDCPQRDERMGWTGDIQVFVRTAALNFDVAGFMTKWAQDVADAQDERGAVPIVAPVFGRGKPGYRGDGGPAWADAVIICPWTIYLCYGDQRILENNYAAMSKFMDFVLTTSPGYIRCAPEYEGWRGFGDWLSINADTPRDLIGTAFLAYDASLMAQIASILGKTDEAARYHKLFADVKAAFAARYLVGHKAADTLSYSSSQVFNTDLFTPTQTAYTLALHFDLLPEELRPLAVAELVVDIERRDLHLSTGFVGSPYLPHVLSAHGRLDIAYALLHQKTWPSWLYSVTQGATTIWERWDGWTEEKGFQDPGMNSFNHYAYGSIGAWLYTTVAGIEIDPKQPGHKHVILRPQPGGDLTAACGKLKTLFGELVSEWKIADNTFDWTLVVPPNTTATAYLPMKTARSITLNGAPAEGTVHEITAGKYRFVVSNF